MTEDRKGGRGQCSLCGEWHGNVSYHEAWECPERIQPAPDWLTERMEKVSKMPPPTLEEVKQQFEASARQRAILDEIPKVSQEEFVKMLTQR